MDQLLVAEGVAFDASTQEIGADPGGGSRIGTELCDEFVHPFEEVFARLGGLLGLAPMSGTAMETSFWKT